MELGERWEKETVGPVGVARLITTNNIAVTIMIVKYIMNQA